MSKHRAYYVLSTHWDREWRQSFQDFRYYFVRLMDHVLAGFEDGRLKGPFHTDGQAVILEDYLAVRPDQRKKIENYAKMGNLSIGPWYTLPDEFCVSGESLIRNLQMGRETARSFGAEPSDVGFASDMFGHISQLPQIFTGFGIKSAFLWRGINTDNRNVIWQGADGTQIVCYRCGKSGYGSYVYYVYRFYDYEREIEKERFTKELDAYIDAEAKSSDIDAILLFDGCDHLEWNEAAYELLCQRMQQGDGSEKIVHSTIDEYFKLLIAQRDKIKTKVEGELREPGRDPMVSHVHPLYTDMQWLIPGVLSSRVALKQANNTCQTLLCQWAEPFGVFAEAATGLEYPKGFLDIAWKFLLENHAHDSICCCSVDQVHKDMEYRFDQCRLIAERVTSEATHKIAASVAGDIPDKELRVVVFNPLPRDFDQVTELTLKIPDGWSKFTEFFGYELIASFRVYDANGNEIEYQLLAQAMEQSNMRARALKSVEAYKTTDVKVALHLSIPAMGYTTLTVRSGQPHELTRFTAVPGLATSERSMENEKLIVKIESDGTVSLTDKKTNQTYNELLTFEDRADIGDGWFHGVAVNDQIFISGACRCDIALVHNGPMLTTFRIRKTMPVPAQFNFAMMTRSEELIDMVVDSYISLRPKQEYLEVKTVVNNVADDHRLRVLFPTGADTQTYLSDSAFDVIERPISLRKDNHKYRELEVETKPQQSWTAVFDDRRGLAIVSKGLLETAVCDLPQRSIALTLFRGTRRTYGTNGEPNGQSRGRLTFDYLITPLAGQPDRIELCELGQGISAGIRGVQLLQKDRKIYKSVQSLPPTASLLTIEGRAIISSIRNVNHRLEVRMFNPQSEKVSVSLDIPMYPNVIKRPTKIQYVDLESNPIGQAGAISGKTEIQIGPKKIVTVQLF